LLIRNMVKYCLKTGTPWTLQLVYHIVWSNDCFGIKRIPLKILHREPAIFSVCAFWLQSKSHPREWPGKMVLQNSEPAVKYKPQQVLKKIYQKHI
jgi:hypothetical protein